MSYRRMKTSDEAGSYYTDGKGGVARGTVLPERGLIEDQIAARLSLSEQESRTSRWFKEIERDSAGEIVEIVDHFPGGSVRKVPRRDEHGSIVGLDVEEELHG
jgi:hypothetical protein